MVIANTALMDKYGPLKSPHDWEWGCAHFEDILKGEDLDQKIKEILPRLSSLLEEPPKTDSMYDRMRFIAGVQDENVLIENMKTLRNYFDVVHSCKPETKKQVDAQLQTLELAVTKANQIKARWENNFSKSLFKERCKKLTIEKCSGYKVACYSYFILRFFYDRYLPFESRLEQMIRDYIPPEEVKIRDPEHLYTYRLKETSSGYLPLVKQFGHGVIECLLDLLVGAICIQTLLSLGGRSMQRSLFLSVYDIVYCFMLSALFEYVFNADFFDNDFISSVIVAPICEEIYYQKCISKPIEYLVKQFERRSVATQIARYATAAFFSVAHFPNYLGDSKAFYITHFVLKFLGKLKQDQKCRNFSHNKLPGRMASHAGYNFVSSALKLLSGML